jgi:tetratricopeptide (TPR) repeat protein
VLGALGGEDPQGLLEGGGGEALAIYRGLTQANPDAYRPDVAMTLNNRAVLYRNTQRLQEAQRDYGEALTVYRSLAEANPDLYLPFVATMLNNLGNFYLATEQVAEAQTHVSDAERVLEPLWLANPELHGNQMAKTLWTHALCREAAKDPTEACALARRALAAAWDPTLKGFIQEFIASLCPPPDAGQQGPETQ